MSSGSITIIFSDDEFKAYGDFVPGAGEDGLITMDYARNVIMSSGLEYGIDWDAIESAVVFCNLNKKTRKGVKIATGDLPVSEKPAYWSLEEKYFNHYMGFKDDELKVDYKEKSPFIMVKKGELIARMKEGREGSYGKSVKGKPIPFEKKKIVQFSPGRNTHVHEGGLYATTSGRYEVSESRVIDINDVLIIEGNVDYSTGNISFAKDVIINGEVKDGFKVAAGGSIYCKSNLDATDVICRNDLTCDQGIIGKGIATVKVGGKVSAKFIENCDIESKSGIYVEKNIMNCKVFTLGIMELGEKGAIVNCEVTAESGVVVTNLGKEGSQGSIVNVGYSFIEKRGIDALSQRLDILSEKLHHLEIMPESRKTPARIKLINQMRGVLTQGKEDLSHKKAELYKITNGYISVKGKAYPGNHIIINGIKHTITEEISRVRFFLNIDSHRIEHESI